MKKKQENTIGKILGGIIIILGVIAITNAFRQSYSLKKYKRYIVGFTTKKEKATKSGYRIYYNYYYNGVNYEGHDEYVKGIKYPNVRYYVWISSERPDYNEFTRIEVPDSIKVIPSDGWAEIPK